MNNELYAHNVKTSEDVAATFHIEPNHNPKAGEQSRAWFALTRKGGQVIPLEQCNCKLAVYPERSAANSPLLLEPLLKAISAEQYRGIPAADIVFPKPGVYQLRLSGAPKAGGNFKPFEFKYQVTVGAGASAQRVSSQTETRVIERSPSTNQWEIPAIVATTFLALGVLGFVWLRFKKRY